ncbi:carbohydrate esterase family 16 protein [Nemania serpens]|nr:carbohydrate esterase family 16 protein [Nemania serpens]
MGNPATLGNRCDHPDPALGININTSHGDTGFDGGALFDLTVPYLRLVVSRVRLRATMLFLILLLGGFTVGIHGYARHRIQNLVVFGDSYTDEGRLGYFLGTGGVAPPPGTIIPTSNATAGGGYSWPYYASKQLGAATYNYAVAGATCSNEIVYRYLDQIHGPYPSVIDYEIPAFQADLKFTSTNPQTPLLRHRTPENTVYSLWIGTNDLGNGGFLFDLQVSGKTISDYVDCIWSVFDGIYSTGGRQFALFSQAPLELSPLYAAIQNGGAGNGGYWDNKTAYDTVAYEEKIREYTTLVNTIYDYGAPFQLLVRKRWPGASFIVFNTHQIILDIHNNPDKYLTAPANVTGTYHTCPASGSCFNSEHPLSSFLWYDDLHPSARAGKLTSTFRDDVILT